MFAIAVLAAFGLFMAIFMGYVANIQDNVQQLNLQRTAATQEYMRDIERVVKNDITPLQLHANPSNLATVESYINGTPSLAQLSNGRGTRPATDAWNRPLSGLIMTQNRQLFTDISGTMNASLVAPVTGILLVSPGPDGVSQTSLAGITTLLQLQGVTPGRQPGGASLPSDDIVNSFTDEEAQLKAIEQVRDRLSRIASASLRNFEQRLNRQRAQALGSISNTLALVSTTSVNQLISVTTAGVFFNTLNDSASRQSIGVNEDFDSIERVIPPSNTQMLVSTSLANGNKQLIIRLVNNNLAPSPWRPNLSGQPMMQLNVEGL
jgi:hypothetical protein